MHQQRHILPYVDEFMYYLKSNKYSLETVYNYERDLNLFECFVSDSACLNFAGLNKTTIEQYKIYLTSAGRKTSSGEHSEKKLGVGSANRALSSLRRYLQFLTEKNLPTSVPPDVIKLIKPPHKTHHIDKFADLMQLIESPMKYEKDKMVALRNRAALETLFASGVRISELINLKRVQIDKTGKIFIQGKGKKQRFIYLTERAKKHIENYLKERSDDSPYLFIPNRGLNAIKRDKHISANYLQMKIKKYRQ